MIKLVYVVNQKELDNGGISQAAILNDGKLQLLQVKRDINGVIRQVINTSNKQPYTKVQMYNNSASALNLTEKETKELISKGMLDVFRSSGAVNDKGETMTREEQIVKGVARKITITCDLVNKNKPNETTSYVCQIINDTGASVKLEGEYTL